MRLMKRAFATALVVSGCVGALTWLTDPLNVAYTAEAQSSLAGTISSSVGSKLEGVTLSARAYGSNMTTTVFTDADGDYFFPSLPAGKYKVWAQAQAFDADRVELTIGVVGSRRDIVLKP